MDNLEVHGKTSPKQRPPQLEPGWASALQGEFELPYMVQLRAFLKAQIEKRVVIFPRGPEIFNALNMTPPEKVKVVILGQDPYHGPNQAHGLCFSVREGVKPPPSLENIFAELERDLKIPRPKSGDLSTWAEQGVLLLNATLTVEQAKAGSHQNKGWETFTDRVIRVLNERQENLVFMLWGSYAQKKGQFIDARKHLVLKSVHPSPLSAYRGFIGCGHFSLANKYLIEHGKQPIDWALKGPLKNASN